MTWVAKKRLMIVISLTMALGFIMMHSLPIGRIVLFFVWIFHIAYFIFGIKTIKNEYENEVSGVKTDL